MTRGKCYGTAQVQGLNFIRQGLVLRKIETPFAPSFKKNKKFLKKYLTNITKYDNI